MLEIPRCAGVVLDLDDTLYSERTFHDSGFRWIAQKSGLDPHGPEVQAARHALRNGGQPLEILSLATGLPTSVLLDWHRSHRPAISLYPDAARFLARLSDAGIPIVLLTDGRSTTQQNKIDALGIRGLLTAVLVSGETGLAKADVQAFRNAATHLARRCPLIHVGDNPSKDVVHPASLGWQVLLLLHRGDNVHPQPTEVARLLEVDLVASFDEIHVVGAGE